MSVFSPLFIWTDVMLKSGKSALDSMQTVAKRAQSSTRVGVIPTADAPRPRRASAGKRKARVKAKGKAKSRRR